MTGVFIALLFVALIPAFIASGKGRSFFLWYIYGYFLFLFAFFHALLIKPNENAAGMRKCSKCDSVISASAKICPQCKSALGEVETKKEKSNAVTANSFYCGNESLDNAEYQLHLIKKYKIEKNEVLGKYVYGEKSFTLLEDVLSAVHLIEQDKHGAYNELKKGKDFVVEQGKIGDYDLDYFIYGDGHVLVSHSSSSWKKEYNSIDEAIADKGKINKTAEA